jgi:hypothetical protein
MIETAEASLRSARALLEELDPHCTSVQLDKKDHHITGADAKAYDSGESQIVEGTFDGQAMVGPEGKTFPVPANYASKSKLVEGDRLKLTILPNGTFLYKQIAPVDREFVRGALLKEDGQFKVVAGGKSYRVLLASVTYYKGCVGDDITLIVPKDHEAIWGTIEAVIPAVGGAEVKEGESF